MTYTNLELLRKQLADPFKFATDNQVGDGETTIYQLAHERVQTGTYTIYVDGDAQTITTEFTIDLDRGIVTFVTPPEANKEIKINYYFTAFSDLELTEFLALENNNVDRVCIRCIDILLMDSSRRFDYVSGQTEIKASQVFKNLKELREIFLSNLRRSSGGVKIINRLDSHYENEVVTETDLSRLDS